jgi:hypothetical protein
MKKLLLLIIGMVLFVSVSAQIHYYRIYEKDVCRYTDDNVLIGCENSQENCLFEISGGFKYVTRYFGNEAEYMKCINAFKISGANAWMLNCYNMVTYSEYDIIVDYDNSKMFVASKAYTDVAIIFYWSEHWTE